jgi:nicotinamidase-related amidase
MLTVQAGAREPLRARLQPVPPLKGEPRDFCRKSSDIRKSIERSNRRVCGYAAGISGETAEIDRALDNCRKVLDHSRRIGLPVAFIRMLNESAFFNRATPFVRWIEGFEPYRNEMIFERSSPSCYSCEPFTALVNQSRGGIVLAGFAGESACLSTLIDAFHRNHKVTYLCDASASHALDDMSADEIHRAVSKISGLYGEVYETTDWIEQTLPRKLGNGKNAGG